MVQVCPGTYPEQVTITQPVTLQGISLGDSDQAVIALPTAGLAINAMDDFGDSLAVQIWLNNASGPVNISNLTIDGAGNNLDCSSSFVVGVFFQNSSGTANHLTTQNQKGGCGVGIWLEGGSSNPSVTVQNSSIHDFDLNGIMTETNSGGTSELTATIKGNVVNVSMSGLEAIRAGDGATSIVNANFIAGASNGIVTLGTGAVSGNTITNSASGIAVYSDATPVTSNKIFNSSVQGIYIASAVATIQGNSITNAGSVGIEFNCYANPNVHSNTITDAATGIDQVPGTVTSPNTYYNVGTIKAGC